MQKLQRLFIIALFGSIIFVTNVFLPPPLNYLIIVVQAVLLALSALFIPKVGAMYVGAVGGLLTALGQPSFGSLHILLRFPLRRIRRRFSVRLQNQRFPSRRKPQPVDCCHGRKHPAHCRFKLFGIRHFPTVHQFTRVFVLLVCLFKEAQCSMRWCCLWVQSQVQWLVMRLLTCGISTCGTSASKADRFFDFLVNQLGNHQIRNKNTFNTQQLGEFSGFLVLSNQNQVVFASVLHDVSVFSTLQTCFLSR